MNNFANTTEDLGRNNGLQTALAVLREARQEATDTHIDHQVKMIDALDAMKAGDDSYKVAYEYHAARRAYFLHKQEALLDVINEIKEML